MVATERRVRGEDPLQVVPDPEVRLGLALWARRLTPQALDDLRGRLAEPWCAAMVRSLGRCGLATMASLQRNPPATAVALAAVKRMTAELRRLADEPPTGWDASVYVAQLETLVEDGDPIGLRAMVEARAARH